MNTMETAFSKAGILLSERQFSEFDRFYELLTERNKVMNLTAITEYQDVIVKHFVDSAMLWPLLNSGASFCAASNDAVSYEELIPDAEEIKLPEKPSVIDVGTGAGFPGLPLKIVNPDCELFLLDALQKRIDFLSEVVTTLDLSAVTVRHDRAEDAARAENGMFREHFDIAVSRAVANLSVLSEYCLPFVKVGGYFAAYKSGKIEEELSGAAHALTELGGRAASVKRFILPGTEEERSIVLIRKVTETPGKYPRKAGKPVKSPL